MIGYNHLGRNGRLGNQMFQYAALKGIAANRGYEYCIPPDEHFLFDFFEMPDVKHTKFMPNDINVGEAYFHFNEELFNTCPDNINLIGYFQSEKYFKNITEDIKKDFTFKSEIRQQAKSYLDDIKNKHGDNLLCLNIRRADYLWYPNNHPCCTIDYYEEALNSFDKDMFVLVVTDETDNWMEQHSLFKQDRFKVVDRNLHYSVLLCIMSMIDQQIIANSTFYWWSAWLSDKKRIITPKRWFGPGYNYLNTKDLIPENWIRI